MPPSCPVNFSADLVFLRASLAFLSFSASSGFTRLDFLFSRAPRIPRLAEIFQTRRTFAARVDRHSIRLDRTACRVFLRDRNEYLESTKLAVGTRESRNLESESNSLA